MNLSLSNLAYCGYESYDKLAFTGDVDGFVVTKNIYDEKKDTHGYIGYLPSDKSIFVVFRGSVTA